MQNKKVFFYYRIQ